MKKTYLDQILAHRPKDGAAATIIEASVTEVTSLRDGFAAKAKHIRAERKASLLKLSGEELNALDIEAASFEIAVEQANEVLKSLAEQLSNRRNDERLADLRERRASLDAAKADFARRFHQTYAPFVEQFKALMDEYQALEKEKNRLNKDMGKLDSMGRPVTDGRSAVFYEFGPISEVYVNKVCLPVAGLEVEDRFRVSMAHHGKFWLPDVEPEPQEALTARWADAERRSEIRRADQEALERRLNRERGEHAGAGPDLASMIADEAAQTFKVS